MYKKKTPLPQDFRLAFALRTQVQQAHQSRNKLFPVERIYIAKRINLQIAIGVKAKDAAKPIHFS